VQEILKKKKVEIKNCENQSKLFFFVQDVLEIIQQQWQASRHHKAGTGAAVSVLLLFALVNEVIVSSGSKRVPAALYCLQFNRTEPKSVTAHHWLSD